MKFKREVEFDISGSISEVERAALDYYNTKSGSRSLVELMVNSERTINELFYQNRENCLDSMEKMIGEKDKNRKQTKENIMKLNKLIKKEIKERLDINMITINYNETLIDPEKNVCKILEFLNLPRNNIEKMINAVDKNLCSPKKLKT